MIILIPELNKPIEYEFTKNIEIIEQTITPRGLKVETNLKNLFSFQLGLFRNYHPETCTVNFMDNFGIAQVYDSMIVEVTG